MRMRILAVGMLLASAAQAKDINLPLTEQEQAALREILDMATKAGGLSIARATIHFDEKIKTYQLQADKPASERLSSQPPAQQ